MNEAQVDPTIAEDPMDDIRQMDHEQAWAETTAGPNGTEETSSETVPDKSGETNRPGIDVVLQDVENQFGKEHADVIRLLQTNYQRAQTATKTAQKDFEERLEEIEGRLSEEPEEDDPDDPLNALTDEQWDIFDRMAKKRGLVSREEVDTAQNSSQQVSYVQSQIDEALESWGENFGYRDANGDFQFNPDRFDEVEQVYGRIYDDSKGMTAKDLFMIADYPRVLSQLQDQQGANRRQQRQLGTVETRTSNARRGAPQYKKGTDDLDTVVARSAAIAYRENP
jgi:hypothetical protein